MEPVSISSKRLSRPRSLPLKGVGMAKQMNIVRYRPKDGHKDAVIEAHKKLDIGLFEGALSARLVDCGEWLCSTFE